VSEWHGSATLVSSCGTHAICVTQRKPESELSGRDLFYPPLRHTFFLFTRIAYIHSRWPRFSIQLFTKKYSILSCLFQNRRNIFDRKPLHYLSTQICNISIVSRLGNTKHRLPMYLVKNLRRRKYRY
jgi:hypothetical protein